MMRHSADDVQSEREVTVLVVRRPAIAGRRTTENYSAAR